MMARTVHCASREEYTGYALDAEIRRLLADRRLFRRTPGVPHDAVRETDLALHYLYSIRRDATRTWRTDQERVERAWSDLQAAMERVQAADPGAPDLTLIVHDDEEDVPPCSYPVEADISGDRAEIIGCGNPSVDFDDERCEEHRGMGLRW